MKITVTGWPKSGTTWLCRLLGDALNSPVGAEDPSSTPKAVATEGLDRDGEYYIGQCHAVPMQTEESGPKAKMHRILVDNKTDDKIILMMRDPRDICVSGSYHWGRPLIEFITLAAEGLWPVPHGGGLVPFYRKWLDSDLMHCTTRYESLHHDTVGELQSILDKIGIEPLKPLDEVAFRQSFKVRKAWTEEHGHHLNYGAKWQDQFLRKGVVGDWQNHFGEKETELAEQYFRGFMDEVGYQ